MHENFDMILNRDKNLSKISQLSSDLKDSSSKVGRVMMTVCIVQEGHEEAEADDVAEEVCDVDCRAFRAFVHYIHQILSILMNFLTY